MENQDKIKECSSESDLKLSKTTSTINRPIFEEEHHQKLKELSRKILTGEFVERRDIEQYFWTEKTVNGILDALKYTFGGEGSVCLCTPMLAHKWWFEEGVPVNLLDIDSRFEYLPKYRYFDLRCPENTCLKPDQEAWRIIIFDPPFFYIPLDVLFQAVSYVCEGKFKQTKLLLGFLKREEKKLLETFKVFNLQKTNFPLEYTHVKPNKWVNYSMYSNVDLPGIKRIQKNYK